VESESTFDAASEQYVLSAKFSNSSRIELPAFTVNDIEYQSASIQFNTNNINDDNVNVYTSGANGNCCYSIPNTNIIELAIMPRVIDSNYSILEVVTAANEVNKIDNSFSVFYSQPITVSASSVSLINTTGFSVVKGDDDANDVVLPGTTVVSSGIDIPVSFSTSLNNTKLKITPTNSLSADQNYEYSVNSLVVTSTEESVNIQGDSLSFSIDVDESVIFDINDVRLDNNNYTTNGAAIVASNSAGDVASPNNYRGNVSIYLPLTINTLQSFTLRLVSKTKDGISSNSVHSYVIVRDGNTYYNTSTRGLVQLALNEILVRDNYSALEVGTAQPDSQKIYRTSTSEYFSDDLTNSENSLTFEYAYETKAGVISTGIITIPVQ